MCIRSQFEKKLCKRVDSAAIEKIRQPKKRNAIRFVAWGTVIFSPKDEWYIFILSVRVRLVKKFMLTFTGLGGNMKAK